MSVWVLLSKAYAPFLTSEQCVNPHFSVNLTQCGVQAAVSSTSGRLGLTSSSPAGCFFVASRESEGDVLRVFDADSGREEGAVAIPEGAGSSNLLSSDTSVLVIPRAGKRRQEGAVVLQF